MNRRRQGFTLLEVIVAVAILAIGLSSLFSSEAAAIKMAQRARMTTLGTLLARCKMAEIEERLAKEGWPATPLSESDECCEDAEREGFHCEWTVTPIVLPEMSADDPALEDLEDAAGAPGADAMDRLSNLGVGTGVPLSGEPTDILGALTEGDGSGSDPIASLVLQMAFPVMKPLIEEQVRRVDVEVKWNEGAREQSFSVAQYLINEQPMLAADEDDDDDDDGSTAGSTRGGGGSAR